MSAETLTSTRELDSRVSGGLEVRLLWCEHDDRVWVSVTDARTGEAFRLEVAEHERPVDVFNHPYAYAAQHHADKHSVRSPGARSPQPV
jgi:hypothetical protein